ncbi:integrase core domain-containing protein [uncultured Desulfovibrio sp.]|uniref:integrase core domain-containing protein n=1 Tax=uncultured Desulfovibrio sp. TaxID=167968 RepID=UPI00349F3650
MFSSVHDARQTVEAWRQDYNQRRPHSSLGWLTPEEFCRQNRPHNPTGTTNLQVVYAMG